MNEFLTACSSCAEGYFFWKITKEVWSMKAVTEIVNYIRMLYTGWYILNSIVHFPCYHVSTLCKNTDIRKNKNLPCLLHTYVLIFLNKTNLNEICSPFNYASFDVFCVQISHLFEPHWGCDDPRKFVFDIDFASKCQSIAARIADQFGRKMYQKGMLFNWHFVKNTFVHMNCRLSNIRSVHTYEVR